MGAKTAIEWTDASWTPIRARNIKTGKVGWYCEHATTGCEFCYAEGINKRLGTGLSFKPGHRKDVELFLDETMLLAPLRWKKPRMIFVCSMTDLFADFVTDKWIDRVFAVMALTPQHTFQVLTKRAERMRKYFGGSTMETCQRVSYAACEFEHQASFTASDLWSLWPLPNVWLGVSAERQQEFDERWPHLRDTPAAVRFISYEPALGPLDIVRATMCRGDQVLDWLICGGESGPGARPMNPQWARDVRDQCRSYGIAFFHKQNGEYASVSEVEGAGEHFQFEDGRTVRRVGKSRAGRLLDGIEHNAMPERVTA